MDNCKIKYSLDNAITGIKELNSSFSLGTLKVAYTGLNYNHSSISRAAFEVSAPTMYNCPIVANYDMVSDEIGGHDEGFVQTEDGMKYVNLTQPVGVIPESATYHWEQIEDNGIMHDYFCIDGVILWKRQPCYSKLVNNGITSQSIEINIDKGVMTDGVLHIEQFEYEAFCLLERDDPCFEQASLQVFAKDEFKKQLQEMMAEYAATLNTQIEEGGTPVDETKQELFTEEVKDSVEQPKTGVVVESNFYMVDSEPTGGEIKFDEVEQKEEFALTANQKRQALQVAIDAFCEDQTYYVEDFDDSEVIVYDYASGKIFGYAYTIDGSSAVVDQSSVKEKMLTYVDLTDAVESNASLADVINSIVAASTSSLSSDYDAQIVTLNNSIEGLNTQIQELTEFKLAAMAADRQAKETELFSQFDGKLKYFEDYKSLKEHASEYSLDELETQCYALLGKQSYNFSKSPTMTTQRVPIDFSKDETDNEPYGGLLKKYKNYGGKK